MASFSSLTILIFSVWFLFIDGQVEVQHRLIKTFGVFNSDERKKTWDHIVSLSLIISDSCLEKDFTGNKVQYKRN